ncbi:MAG: SDR family oxidoreductase [Fibrobacterota bacterium]|nr:SDR family oxidoreductase [Fibrobacterota bacterium]QQS05787.1 MAG: SDR family oxidoreductase [Fibrobacterota bacterium]
MEWKQTTSLITGASSGIGQEFARELAKRGSRVVLVARREDRLHALAQELVELGAVAPVVIPMDLACEDAATALKRQTDELGLQIDALINNAGFSEHGSIHEISPQAQGRLLQLNVSTMAGLVSTYLPGMRSKGRGAIVNLASIASFHPLPTQAAYAASKAFVLSYTESLWEESRGSGVRVLALCPGATATGFFERLGQDVKAPKHTPKAVVETALRALDKDRMTVVDGWWNAFLSRFLPRITCRKLAARVSGAVIRRMYRA